jgi:nucleoside triphosphatase
MEDKTMRQRTIVCPIIQNNGEYLLCQMADDRGVFPGQWALSGGGMEPGETMEQALLREIAEELGDKLEISQITPWHFRDDTRIKTYADGSKEEIYMIYLMFDCVSANRDITFNEEFQAVTWVRPEQLREYDLNVATRQTFIDKGLL